MLWAFVVITASCVSGTEPLDQDTEITDKPDALTNRIERIAHSMASASLDSIDFLVMAPVLMAVMTPSSSRKKLVGMAMIR